MATSRRSVMKELHKLLRKADTLYDGQVEFVLDDGEKMDVKEEQEDETEVDDRYMSIYFFVKPKDGLYRNARVKFHMRVNFAHYPDSSPEINCLNNIYHPNINVKDPDYYDDEADICVNLLGGDWEPEVGLDGAVMAVLFLFYNPQLDDALSPVCTGSEDYEEYKANVRRSLRGEDIDGYSFDKLLNEEIDTEDNEVGVEDVEKVITKDDGEKKHGGAEAVSENIIANVEKVEEIALKTSDAEIENEPEHSLTGAGPVTDDNTINDAVIIEQDETSDIKVIKTTTSVAATAVTTAATTATTAATPVITVATAEAAAATKATTAATAVTTEATDVTTAAETTNIASENNEPSCHTADSSVTIVIESNQQTPLNSNLTHRNTPRSSFLKLKVWYSKLKDRLSLLNSSFKKRS